MAVGSVFGKEDRKMVAHLPRRCDLVFASPVSIAVKQLKHIAKHRGRIGSIYFLHDKKEVLIGILNSLNVCLEKRTRHKFVRDVRLRFASRLANIVPVSGDWLEAPDELWVRVVRVERYARDVLAHKRILRKLV